MGSSVIFYCCSLFIVFSAMRAEATDAQDIQQAFFIEEDFHYLNVPRAGIHTVYDMLECTHKCLRNPSCLSLNVAAYKGDDERFWCELLTLNKDSNPEEYRENGSSHHLYIDLESQSPCVSSPCQNRGTCVPNNRSRTFECKCKGGFFGEYCESEHCIAGLDIGIILDKSKSVGLKNLKTVIEALKDLVKQFNPSPQGDHFGLITFHNTSTLVFDFKDPKYQEESALKDKLDSEKRGLHLNTHTDLALEMARDKLFTAAGGDREEKPNALLILTDGEPYWGRNNNSDIPSDKVFKEFAENINKQFQAKNVHKVVIGFGPKANNDRMIRILHSIAGTDGEVFQMKDIEKEELPKIKEAVCSAKQ